MAAGLLTSGVPLHGVSEMRASHQPRMLVRTAVLASPRSHRLALSLLVMTGFTHAAQLVCGNHRVSLRACEPLTCEVHNVIELFDHSDANTIVDCVAAVALSLTYLCLDALRYP